MMPKSNAPRLNKFAGMPVRHPDILARRRAFVPVYMAIWAFVVASGAVALRDAPAAALPDERPFAYSFRRLFLLAHKP